MNALEVGALWLIPRLDERLKTRTHQFGNAAAQDDLFAEQVGFGLLGKGRFQNPAARPADSFGVGQAALLGGAGRVLVDCDQARNTATLGKGSANEFTGAFGRDHQHIDVFGWLNLPEVNIEAVGEQKRIISLEVRLDLLAVNLSLRFVG